MYNPEYHISSDRYNHKITISAGQILILSQSNRTIIGKPSKFRKIPESFANFNGVDKKTFTNLLFRFVNLPNITEYSFEFHLLSHLSDRVKMDGEENYVSKVTGLVLTHWDIPAFRLTEIKFEQMAAAENKSVTYPRYDFLSLDGNTEIQLISVSESIQAGLEQQLWTVLISNLGSTDLEIEININR